MVSSRGDKHLETEKYGHIAALLNCLFKKNLRCPQKSSINNNANQI